jgi:phosphoribosylpyrophosphate synthetase
VPCAADRDEYLPAILTHEIIENFPSKFWETENPLMKSTLTIAKKSAKNMTVEEKIKQWKLIAQKEGINLSRSVKGASVIVVDDLYQSGASLWSFAKFLKSKGASTVVGVACVKSLRDTDNQ